MSRSTVVVLLAALVLACSPEPGPAAGAPGCTLVEAGYGPTGSVPVRVETVAEGLEAPWAVGWLPGGDALVTERAGRVRLLRGGQLVPTPVATLPVPTTGEGGLLGLAVHPDFASTRAFFVFVVGREGGVTRGRVERWRLAEDGASAQLERAVLAGFPAAGRHGGRLRFGPDGMLYVGTGDARAPLLAQEASSLAGKLLRLTPEGEPPVDNPFPMNPVFLLGLRNLVAFDWREDGSLVVADQGPEGEGGITGYDELTVARRGENLGWPERFACELQQGRRAPSLVFAEPLPPGGLAVYTGTGIPEWQGSVLWASPGARQLQRVWLDGGRVVGHEVVLGPEVAGRLRDVGMGPDGHVYVTTSNCDGSGTCGVQKDRVLRVVRQ